MCFLKHTLVQRHIKQYSRSRSEIQLLIPTWCMRFTSCRNQHWISERDRLLDNTGYVITSNTYSKFKQMYHVRLSCGEFKPIYTIFSKYYLSLHILRIRLVLFFELATLWVAQGVDIIREKPHDNVPLVDAWSWPHHKKAILMTIGCTLCMYKYILSVAIMCKRSYSISTACPIYTSGLYCDCD